MTKYVAVKYFRYRKDSSIDNVFIYDKLTDAIDNILDMLDENQNIMWYNDCYSNEIKKKYKDYEICELDCNTSITINNALCEITTNKGYCTSSFLIYKCN